MGLKNKLKKTKTENLIPYSNNPKKHPQEQVDKIASSIKKFGFKVPMLVTEDLEIIAGHGRLQAARKLDLDEVPVIVVDDLSEAEVKAFRIADNKTTESEWDDELLSVEFEELDELDVDVELTGFEDEEISSLLDEQKEAEEDDYEEPDEIDSRCERGQVWKLGEHRLMCGDATSEEDVNRLMDGNKADMVFTDPPYGIDIVKDGGVGVSNETGLVGVEGEVKANKYKEIEGDEEPFDPNHLLNLDCKKLLFGGNFYSKRLPESTHWIVWDKKANRGADHNNFSDAEIIWTDIDKKSTPIYRCLWSGMIKEGESGERLHPTQKPIKLLSDILTDYSEKEELILDPYGGSGSTLIACEQLDRKCYMMEIDPEYCEVIMQRWEELTGREAELIE